MTVTALLAALTVFSIALLFWQCLVGLRFPLHQRQARSDFAPPVTVLKPLKGYDAETSGCLRSWLTQDYGGPIEVLFGVASPQDPVCDLIRSLVTEYPGTTARLVICSEQLGANAKVSQLAQLQRSATHPVLCVSDADVWVPPDFLRNAVAPLRDEAIGLTNSLYRLARENNFAMRWEAFAVNADFWSQVLQSVSLQPMDFALGAALVTTRRHLEGIGGFSALVDHLADDYQLGNRIARQGARLTLCPVVVECRSAPMSYREVWAHQLRWARTIRICRPAPFFFTILSNASLWPLLWLMVGPSPASAVAAGTCVAIRLAAGGMLEARLTGRWRVSSVPMPLIKDLLQIAVWILSFTGRRIVWRGVEYQVDQGGKLIPARCGVGLENQTNPINPIAEAAGE